jgi:alpha-tubulin suppressor-like RCC1 family protein
MMLATRRHGHGGKGKEGKEEAGAHVVAGAGVNQWGNLGTGWESSTINYFIEGVELSSRATVKKVRILGGGGALLALMTNGDVWGCGVNNLGDLCDGTFLNKPKATKSLLKNVVDLEAGGGGAYALHADGSVSSWGANGEGQLANGEHGHAEIAARQFAKNEPVHVYPPGSGVVQIAASAANAGAVFADGHVEMWGDNNEGQIGNKEEDTSTQSEFPVDEPVTVWPQPGYTLTEGEHAVELAIGAQTKVSAHCVMRRKDGRLMAWGTKGNGECAIEPFTSGAGRNLTEPTLVPNESAGKPISGLVGVAKIIASPKITFTINASKELYVFGRDELWGAGLGYIDPIGAPKSPATRAAEVITRGEEAVVEEEWGTIVFPPQKVHDNVLTVGCEQSCTGVVLTNGELLTAGKNGTQQLGRGEPADQFVKKGHAAVPSLAAAPGLTGVSDCSVSLEAMIAQCESCTAKSFITFYAKLRGTKVVWESASSAAWKALIKKLESIGQPLTEEEEAEAGAQYNRRRQIFLGATSANGLSTVPATRTFTEACGGPGKEVLASGAQESPPVFPATSVIVQDGFAGNKSEAALDLTTADGKEVLAEMTAGAKLHVVKFKWHGNPGGALALTSNTAEGSSTFNLTGAKAKGYVNGAVVVFRTLTSNVTTPSTGTRYFVVNEATNSFGLALTEGGTPIVVAGHIVESTSTTVARPPQLGLKWIKAGKEEGTIGEEALKFGERGEDWYGQSLSNAVRGKITTAVMSLIKVFAQTGSETWTADEIYIQCELEWPQEQTGVPEAERQYEFAKYKAEGLEPGDLYQFKIGGGPGTWQSPTSMAVIQGIRKIEALKTKHLTSGSLQVQAFGATGNYTISGQPAGAHISATGLIEWTLTGPSEAAKTVTVEVEGKDDEGIVWKDKTTFSWTVT